MSVRTCGQTPADVAAFDSMTNDPRRAADRAAARCEHCGRYVRWIENIMAVREGGRMQIEARVVASDAWFEASEHRGLVAVFADGTGFTVSRFTPADAIEGALLYRCHWDVCEVAEAERNTISRDRALKRARAERREAGERFAAGADRYEQWLRTREP